MPVEAVHSFGLLAFLVEVVAFSFLLWRWPQGRHVSLSRHAATQRASYLLFAGVLLINAALIYVFLWQWLGPKIGVAGWFYYLLIVAAALQVIIAFVPDHPTRQTISRVHLWAALVVFALMIPVTVGIGIAPHVNLFARFVAGVAAIWMALSICLFFFVKRAHQHYLFFQGAYLLSFYLVIFCATYIL